MKICSMMSFFHTFYDEMKPSQHFNVGSTLFQRWNNVDPMLKMKQNPTSDFHHCKMLIQRQCPTLKQRRNKVTQRRNNVGTTFFTIYLQLTANEISKIFLTVVDIVMHNGGNNGDIHRSLKYYCIQNFKTCLKNIKI